MRCSKAQVFISTAMDGELNDQERVALARHLEGCTECVTYQHDLEACHRLLQETESAPSAQFEWMVQLGIRKALRSRASAQDTVGGRFWLPASISALSVMVVVLGLGLWLLPGSNAPSSISTTPNLLAESASSAAKSPALGFSAAEEFAKLQKQTAAEVPAWRLGARPDWRTPPSLLGHVSTVNALLMGSSEDIGSQLRFGSRYVRVPGQGAVPVDSLRTSGSGSPH
jgi:anti-sigma factor RsiW